MSRPSYVRIFARISRVRSWAVASSIVALASGCQEELPEIGAQIYQGDDFEVWASDGLVACGGTHAYTEGWLAAFRRRLGAEARPTSHRFFWLSPEDIDRTPCSLGTGACAFTSRTPKSIYTPLIPHEHEIVHVELAHLVGPPLLTEGAAEMFGTSRVGPNELNSYPVGELLDGDRITGLGYPSAGRFSRFLVDTYGMDTYFDLLREAEPKETERGLRDAFDDALGIPVDDVIAEYETFPACDSPRWRYHDYECEDLPAHPWSTATRWQESIALDCAENDVIGPRPDDFYPSSVDMIWVLRAIDVETPGLHLLRLESSEPATAYLEPCVGGCFDGGPAAAGLFASVEIPPFIADLAVGRYWLRVLHPAASRAEVTVTLDRLEG